MEFNHRPFVLHRLLLFFFVSIFLIQTGEELLESFLLLDGLFFIICPSEGLIVLCYCFDCTYGQANDGAHIGCRLGGFVFALLLLRIVGIIILRQPPKSRNSPDTSPDSTAEDAAVISRKRRFKNRNR